MSTCPQCGASVAANAHNCPQCGADVIFHYVPHPRIAKRKEHAPFKRRDLLPSDGAIQRFNAFLAVKITSAVGTMWCAYLFAGLALVSLPEAIRGGTAPLIAWIAQTFLQLVLLSIIMVGQKVAAAKSDRQLEQTYKDAEALLKISDEIQTLLKQNTSLTEEIHQVVRTGKKA